MNFIKLEPEPDGESYLSSFHNENQENDVAQDENLKHVGCPIMKTENDVIMDFIKSEPNSDCETCLKFSHSENEMVDVKEEEDPILITFPVVKPENEGPAGEPDVFKLALDRVMVVREERTHSSEYTISVDMEQWTAEHHVFVIET
ncbi:uncharacterized protein LOC111866999 isoform X1 [Cryptotermes secundus]|uniref:uncharacterized protein LOC111866999 isoform X1 n=1 Tax=Cryptotermes secundus TaxID=105785 RepID=UPI000CD7CC41|nr:uncharacterized protein LOC111866999 isoform X1 [Cryptotermes secundus]XP_023712202.1 uncharacterized protein LOC111866999 isoform X1 [Cryptotermes secundus]XP_023712203.1 uncharacterized protein LOC111866999 isoform X1 [Cryptotermes secundus]XP_023712204.1 uncharacterized protein LOC111866999 isoform X1 [Cryptotermes secundus]XP_023712206.1 uncharacterized protein LOC111866999 isoform X1 [Cryptotermes secundus]XP_023712207.1 uncharacterized protein LOC111866999 isoform X1 [Cryptotermes sec